MNYCFIAVGSNLGKRKENIKLAIQKINALKNTQVLKSSKLIPTFPVGGPASQGKYLNGALKIKTSFSPQVLLKKLKIIEKELGRKISVRNGPRPIDLDILLYGDKIVKTKNLIIPHPRMLERIFVMKPLLEIL